MHTPPPLPPTPKPPRTSASPSWRRRLGIIIGATVLAAGAVGIGTAAAQTEGQEPTPPADDTTGMLEAEAELPDGDTSPFDECLDSELGEDPEELDEETLSPEALEAMDAEWDRALGACEQHLSEEERAEMQAWEQFETCVDEQLGEGFWTKEDEVWDDEALDESQLDAAIAELDAQFERAEANCAEALPAELRTEMETWKSFDVCVDTAVEAGPFVIVEDGREVSLGAFGEGAGTITVVKGPGGGISVTTEGSASVGDEELFDEQWFEAAEAACEHLVPEDADA